MFWSSSCSASTMAQHCSYFFKTTLVMFLIVLPVIVRPEDCRLQPVLHVLQHPGCTPRSIPSFACVGKCTSYVQVSGSKLWQTERSCMCCQESGEREATVVLSCPKAPRGTPQTQKVVTKAPVDCMCRPCTVVEEGSVLPQEMAGYLESDGSPSFSVRLRL